MAKVKGLFGTNIRGSIGKVTFRMRRGKNVASQKVSGAKKSATPAQIYQRVVGNTTMQAYAAMKSICDHSFEGVQYGALSMSHFLKINNNLLRNLGNKAGFVKKGLAKKVAPSPFIISEGSLPPIELFDNGDSDGENFATSKWIINYLDTISNEEIKKLTPRSFMSLFGLEPTDQISIVANMDNIGTSEYGDREEHDGNPMICSLTRYLFDDAKFDTPMFVANTTSESDSYPFVINEKVLDMTRSTFGSARLIFHKVSAQTSQLGVRSISERSVMMTVGVIASRKSSSGWLRSKCQLSVDAQAKELYAYAYQEVEPTYEYAEEERILNYEAPGTE